MLPATRERERPYDMQARLDPLEAAKARIYALKHEMGPDMFVQYAAQSIWLADHPQPEKERPGHMACMARQCSFTINWQGEMRPCVILTEPAVSVFEVGFENAWKYLAEETDKILLNPKCGVCQVRHMCRTCAASALLETGSYDGVPDYMCRYRRNLFTFFERNLRNCRKKPGSPDGESFRSCLQDRQRNRSDQKMDKLFRIGSFAFRLRFPEEVTPPPNFLLFKCADLPRYVRNGESEFREGDGKEKGSCDVRWEYAYEIQTCEAFPEPTGSVVARRPDLVVFREDSGTQEGKKDDDALESRLISVKGTEGYYACYRETGPDCAEVYLARDRIDGLHFDPMFTSLLALERRMIRKDSLILHCAYMVYHGEAILFSAPSETGKTTQANVQSDHSEPMEHAGSSPCDGSDGKAAGGSAGISSRVYDLGGSSGMSGKCLKAGGTEWTKRIRWNRKIRRLNLWIF